MNRTMLILAVAGASLGLAACNKGGEAKTDVPLAAEAIPTPAVGLWEQTMSGMPGLGEMTMQICVDATSAGDYGASQTSGDCTRTPASRGLDGSINFSVTCTTPSGVAKSSGKVTGDVASDYTVEMTMEMTGSPNPAANVTQTMKIHAVRKGDCPADMAPGQAKMVGMPTMPGMPAGMKMPNIPGAPK